MHDFPKRVREWVERPETLDSRILCIYFLHWVLVFGYMVVCISLYSSQILNGWIAGFLFLALWLGLHLGVVLPFLRRVLHLDSLPAQELPQESCPWLDKHHDRQHR